MRRTPRMSSDQPGMLFDVDAQVGIADRLDPARRAVGAAVARDEADSFRARQDVELRYDEDVRPLMRGIASRDGIEPSASPRPAGSRPNSPPARAAARRVRRAAPTGTGRRRPAYSTLHHTGHAADRCRPETSPMHAPPAIVCELVT